MPGERWSGAIWMTGRRWRACEGVGCVKRGRGEPVRCALTSNLRSTVKLIVPASRNAPSAAFRASRTLLFRPFERDLDLVASIRFARLQRRHVDLQTAHWPAADRRGLVYHQAGVVGQPPRHMEAPGQQAD